MARRWPLALGLALGFLALQLGLQSGLGETESWRLAARYTARVGFPLLIVTYSASSLFALWRGRASAALMRDRRWWGLGFAASHTIHLFALIQFFRTSGEAPSPVAVIGGGAGYVLLFAMALTSNAAAQRALGRNWKRLHRLGIHWLWAVFAFSYVGRIFEPDARWVGIYGFTVAIAALALRIAALRKRRR